MASTLATLVADRRFRRGSTIGVIVLLALVNIPIQMWRERALSAIGRERAAQGVFAGDPESSSRPVRYDWSIGDRLARFLTYIPDARQQPLVILSGMSQMYAINDFKPGDQTIAEYMDDALAPKGVRVFGLAAPNLSQEEALFLLMTASSNERTKPATFIFAVAFEKLREVDLRPHYRRFLRERPELIDEWRRIATASEKDYPRAARKMRVTLEALEARTDVTVEERLRSKASVVIPFVKERTTLNSDVRRVLYDVRNWVFGIDNTTKRPLIPELYDVNREFLGVLAKTARERDVQLILYIVPFNPHADSPYIPEEYAAFKQWLAAFCEKERVPLANFEHVVPQEDWGLFLGGPDFKHFRNAGHRKTADAIVSTFGPLLLRPAGAPR
jgi:hypothetical protein